MEKYKLSDHIFITETNTDIFISVGEKNFKLSNNKNINLRLRKAISDIKKYGQTNDKSIEIYLLKINAIIKESIQKKQKAKKARTYLRENNLSKELDTYLPSNISINDNSNLFITFSKDRKGLFLYNQKFSLLDDIIFEKPSNNYLKYVSVVLSKVLDNNLDNWSEEEILHIDLETYENHRDILSIYDPDNHFLLSNSFCNIFYDFKNYYPLVKATYINILGEDYISFGKSKEECKKNILIYLSSITKYSFFINKQKILKDMKLIDFESLEDAELIFDFYFSEDKIHIDTSLNKVSIDSNFHLEETNFNRLLSKYLQVKSNLLTQ